MQKIREIALREFAALDELEKHLGIDLTAKEVKRKALRDFKESIWNHIAMREFDENKQHFDDIMPEVSAIDADGEPTTTRKKSKKLSGAAKRRVDAVVTAYQATFKMAIAGAMLDFEDEIILQRANYHMTQYEELLSLLQPTKSQLISTFLTWIRESEGISRSKAVDILISFGIPTLNKYDIPYRWKDLSPYSITFRTFEL